MICSTTVLTFIISPGLSRQATRNAERQSSKYYVGRFQARNSPKQKSTSPMTKAKNCLLIFGREYFLIIKSISIDGFRSFSNARLNFVPGQNYIFGHNWQGKSSIVDAIGFALFGLDVFPKKVA